MSFQEIALTNPQYIAWEKEETAKNGTNAHWHAQRTLTLQKP